jgi:hypothetical protein
MWEMWLYWFGFLKNLPISPMLHYTSFPLRLLVLTVTTIWNYASDIILYVFRSNEHSALKCCSCAKVKETHFLWQTVPAGETDLRMSDRLILHGTGKLWISWMTVQQFSVNCVHHHSCRICTAEAIAVNCVVLLLLLSHYWSFVRLTRLQPSGVWCRVDWCWSWHPVRWYMRTNFSMQPAAST